MISKLIDPASQEYNIIKIWIGEEENFSENSKLLLKSFTKTGESMKNISMCITLAELRNNNWKECRGYHFYMPTGEKVAEEMEENTTVEDAVEFVQREINSKYDFFYQIVQKIENFSSPIKDPSESTELKEQNLVLKLEHTEKPMKETFNLDDLSNSVLRDALKNKNSQFCNEIFNTKDEQKVDKPSEEKMTINQCMQIKGNECHLGHGN